MANYNFPVHHGISLEEGSSIENLVIESFNDSAFTPTVAGQVWYSTVTNTYKASFVNATGGIEVMEFAKEADLLAAVARIATLESTYVNRDGSIAFTGNVDAGNHNVINVMDPVNDTDATNKRWVTALVGGLGSAINYAGTIDASIVGGFDLDSLPVGGKDVGDYYKITKSGTVHYLDDQSAVQTITVLLGDGVVKNGVGGWDKIDNTNSTVQGTPLFVGVTGSSDTGFVVDIDPVFKGRVSTLETEVGTLTNLTTNAKTDLTSAVNEVKAEADAIQAELDVTQAAAGLGADGRYTANATANYISTATSLKSADDTLDAALKSEATTRATADTALDGRVTTLESQVNGKIGDLTTLITDDKSNLVNAINEVEREIGVQLSGLTTTIKTDLVSSIDEVVANLATETSNRTAADTAIQSELDATQAGAGLESTGAYAADASTNYIKTATSLKDADKKLDAQVKTNTDGLAAEVARATAAEQTLTTNLAAEVTRATTAEAQEVSDRKAADAMIVTQLNASQYAFESTTADVTFVVTHNLNSTQLLVDVQVQRPDGSWKNDVVSVEYTSVNALTVSLSAARKIRVNALRLSTYTSM